MTFLEIVDAVLADRFSESQRADAKQWVNHRYWWIWSLDPWTFKQGTDAVTITGGSQTVTSLPTDFLHVRGLHDADGVALEALDDPREFYKRYSDESIGSPEAFTVIGGSLLVGPVPTADATYNLLYEKEFTELSADDDVPALPTGSHFALVHGGAAEGLKLQNDPTWQSFEEDFQASLTVLRQNYLSNVKGAATQFGAFRPEQWV